MKNKILILMLTLMCSLTAQALPQDRDQPIHISANSASIDEKTGLTIYIGDVQVTQGTLLIEANRVELQRGDEGVELLTAYGKPAHFRQQPEINKAYTDAWGNTIIYRVNQEHLTLKQQAKIISDQDVFTGDRILYDLKSSVVDAFGERKAGQGGRVEMIIQPKKNKDAQ
ncbi:MAG: lipopolysaccharide transport periplasmic protein LptA [Pontibacterium sp.]